MMTGQVLAGADPIQAVRFQLLMVFTTMASAALTCVIYSASADEGKWITEKDEPFPKRKGPPLFHA